jgi:DNA-binding MarR family transcriptional regulator
VSVESFSWAYSQPNLNPTEKVVLCKMMDNLKPGHHFVWINQTRLAESCRVSVSTLKRALKDLSDRGLIHRQTSGFYEFPVYTKDEL